MIIERHYREELLNVIHNSPVFAGDTISHKTANECGVRGWIKRDENGDWVPTVKGIQEACECMTNQLGPDYCPAHAA